MGCQCPKRLWLHKFQKDVRDGIDESQAAILQTGTDMGMLARELFYGGVDAAPPTPYQYQQSVADTAKYIRKGVNTIYEAAFQFDGIMAAIDILVKKNHNWYAFEVKGSGTVKPQFILDAALQYYVITQSGLPLEDISIIHLNTDYVRNGDVNIQQLFTNTSILKDVMPLQNVIKSKAEELKQILKLKSAPAIEVDDHCFKPYACDFYGFCTKDLGYDDRKHLHE